MSFPVVAKLKNGSGNIHVKAEKMMNGDDDWVPISFQGGTGWTRPKYLTPVNTPTPFIDSTNSADTYRVTGVSEGDKLNVRFGPGTEYEVIARLFNGDDGIRVVDESNVLVAAMLEAASEGYIVPYKFREGGRVFNKGVQWVAIEFGDKKGWVRPEYLKRSPSTTDESLKAGGTAASPEPLDAADPSPEGCYWLANADADRRDASCLEICLNSQNVRETDDEPISTGDFSITIRDGRKALETYSMSSRLTDGSGSHVDFLFAASSATLRKIENTDAYARGNSDPPNDVIYYILFDPEIKGGAPLKSGDKAGYVTIHGQKRSLFKK